MTRHGSFKRHATDKDTDFKLPIIRLLCEVEGQTVSLIPDFLVPNFTHTVNVIGQFLEEREKGKSQREAMSDATSQAPSRQKGAFWERRFQQNEGIIQTYLATRRSRETQDSSLCERFMNGFHSMAEAFLAHHPHMHRQFGFTSLCLRESLSSQMNRAP